VVALLMLAAGFALGLFFGWLLHRERVERALYEDVARHRDRATAALAETSARLELANKDMIRLRSQLTDAQQLLDERDATIDDLQARRADRQIDDDGVAGVAGPVDAAADAATTPSGVTRLDDGDHTDITEEVSLAAPVLSRAASAVEADLGDDNDHTIDVTPAAEAPPAAEVGAVVEEVEPVRGEPEEQQEPQIVPPLDVAAEDAASAEADVGSEARDEAVEPVEVDPGAAEPEVVVAEDEPVGDEPGEVEADEVEPDGVEPEVVVAEDEPGEVEPVGDEPGEVEADEVEPDGVEPEVVVAEVEPVGDGTGDAPIEAPSGDDERAATVVPAEPDRPEIGEPLVVDGSAEDAARAGAEPGDDADAAAEKATDAVAEAGADAPAASTAAPDDLRRIAGIGPALALQLNAEGITTYRQLATLDDEAISELQARRPHLVTRMRRGGWAAQARRLHAEVHDDPI
jgi:predicted flap endonuclease-1-like 5' DNA nuclease